MGQIKDLLDDIERLDKEATRSPWGVRQGDYYEVGPLEDDLGDVVMSYDIVEVADLPDAELIALSRTALPALAQAVRAVLGVLDDYPLPDRTQDPTGYTTARIELLEREIREAISDVIGDGNE